MTTPAGSDNFRKQAISGVSWNLAGNLLRRILHFCMGVVLARLLLPEEFGLLGMALVFTTMGMFFCHLKLSLACVVTDGVGEEHYSTVFWTSLVCSSLVYGVFWLGAPWIAAFYGEPKLVGVVRMLSLVFPLETLLLVPYTILVKNMRFRLVTQIQIGCSLVVGLGTIFLAWRGYGVWALVLQLVLESATCFICYSLATRWRPRVLWQWTTLRSLFRISLNALGNGLMEHWGKCLDNLLIGRFLGAHPLGIYTRSYSLMFMPAKVVSPSFAGLLEPLLTRLRGDYERAGRYYLRSLSMVSLLVMPPMLLLMAGTEDFVLGVFGETWAEMIPVLRVLCILGILLALQPFQIMVLLTHDRPHLALRFGALSFVLKTSAIIIGFRWGLTGIAWTLALAALCSLILELASATRTLRMPLREALLALGVPLLLTAAAAAAARGVYLMIPADWLHLLRLVLVVAGGGCVYLVSLLVLRPQGYRDVESLIKDRLGRSTSSND